MRALLLMMLACLLLLAALLTVFFCWEAIQIEKEGIAAAMENRFQSEPPEGYEIHYRAELKSRLPDIGFTAAFFAAIFGIIYLGLRWTFRSFVKLEKKAVH